MLVTRHCNIIDDNLTSVIRHLDGAKVVVDISIKSNRFFALKYEIRIWLLSHTIAAYLYKMNRNIASAPDMWLVLLLLLWLLYVVVNIIDIKKIWKPDGSLDTRLKKNIFLMQLIQYMESFITFWHLFSHTYMKEMFIKYIQFLILEYYNEV